jgi:hypothetical protein
MEGPAAGRMETVPVIERVQMLLFLMDSDPVDLPFALEADKDSKEDSGHGSERGGRRNEDKESGSEDRDAMVE